MTYQFIFNRGYAEGKAEANAELKAEEARWILLRQGEDRFGVPDAGIRESVESITDLERLERLTLRLLHLDSWQALLNDQ